MKNSKNNRSNKHFGRLKAARVCFSHNISSKKARMRVVSNPEKLRPTSVVHQTVENEEERFPVEVSVVFEASCWMQAKFVTISDSLFRTFERGEECMSIV